jgi:ABC-type Fe3+-siderophore transport system permease subunit
VVPAVIRVLRRLWRQSRVAFVIVASTFVLVLAILLYGLAANMSAAHFFLGAFMLVMIASFIHYFIAKSHFDERVIWYVKIMGVAFVAFSIGAIICFTTSTASNQKPLDDSRSFARECILLFYDIHDVWHFLSGVALAILTLISYHMDDDLDGVPTSTIRVSR